MGRGEVYEVLIVLSVFTGIFLFQEVIIYEAYLDCLCSV